MCDASDSIIAMAISEQACTQCLPSGFSGTALMDVRRSQKRVQLMFLHVRFALRLRNSSAKHTQRTASLAT